MFTFFGGDLLLFKGFSFAGVWRMLISSVHVLILALLPSLPFCYML